jgi:flavodoxin
VKVLFTYRSITGNTRKVVEAMYEEIQADKKIKTFDEAESLEGYDLIF